MDATEGRAALADAPPAAPEAAGGGLLAEIAAAADYARRSKADSTLDCYARDFARFEDWCLGRGLPVLPTTPAVVATYLAALADAGLKVNTIERRLAAIGFRHKRAGHLPPLRMEGGVRLEEVMEGIRRAVGTAVAKKRAATDAHVLAMLEAAAGDGLRALRDRALLAFGFAAALRRSELVAVEVGHLEWTERGVDVWVPRSKADQQGRGRTLAVPDGQRLRPVAHLRAWLDASGISGGPVFRALQKGDRVCADGRGGKPLSDHAVARIVKERALAAGLDPALFSGHSLRRGFATASLAAGASIDKVQRHLGHKDIVTTAGYAEEVDRWRDHPGEGVL